MHRPRGKTGGLIWFRVKVSVSLITERQSRAHLICLYFGLQFELIYHQLYKHIEDVLAHNHAHVIVKLAEGCLRFGTKQEHFVKVRATVCDARCKVP